VGQTSIRDVITAAGALATDRHRYLSMTANLLGCLTAKIFNVQICALNSRLLAFASSTHANALHGHPGAIERAFGAVKGNLQWVLGRRGLRLEFAPSSCRDVQRFGKVVVLTKHGVEQAVSFIE
jgi:hypothetical protein